MKYLLQYNLVDKIIVVPTCDYWSKSMEASLEDRIQMCKLVQSKKIEISTTLNKYEYTYQVLEELEKKYPMDYLFLIMGADNIIHFDKWKNIDHLLEYNIIVVNRDNIDINEYVKKFNKKDNFIVLDDFDFLSISSTYIRSNIESENAKEFLDEKVLNYIKDKNLYK
jgi:nicotinate-nucleotide adenylyltransferase